MIESERVEDMTDELTVHAIVQLSNRIAGIAFIITHS
jgi:hypothetical protein